MALAKRFDHKAAEERLGEWWRESGTYGFNDDDDGRPVFSIDTPPPTVSGKLHLGHMYSYSHADFIARFKRMRGCNVFYPMGFDDNGLPTEHLVERETGRTARDMGRSEFVGRCRDLSTEVERDYRTLFDRLALSVDWGHAYRTIDTDSVRTAQHAFLSLLQRGLVERREAPTIWCPTCRTAIAQAELEDLVRPATFYTLAFGLRNSEMLIATTRPELLHACVAVFVHPDDDRWRQQVGACATVPLFGHTVPVLADEAADPTKGSGAVMCCTFGDQTDVAWWRSIDLPTVHAIDAAGKLHQDTAGPYGGLGTDEARERIVADLDAAGVLRATSSTVQSVRVHDRCETPAEHLVTEQWFVRLLDHRDELRRAANSLTWHPEHMGTRLIEWIDNLKWDWCISRQRSHGVPFPVWTCGECGAVTVATPDQLPVDPTTDRPPSPCLCGGGEPTGEADVMDTWATSSLTPQIAGGWLGDPELFGRVFPFSVRPQAHEIIRTWTFYTLAQSYFHEGEPPWRNVFISGWGILPSGKGKLSKSRGDRAHDPNDMFDAYGADAVRYWAASTGTGRDAQVDEDRIKAGARTATKLWNVARFAERFIGAADFAAPDRAGRESWDDALSPADRWMLARIHEVISLATAAMDDYDYASAMKAVEELLWHDLADNYIEMAKSRLYHESDLHHRGACYALREAVITVVKLMAPFMPYVTDEIFQGLFAHGEAESVHASGWPDANEPWADGEALSLGDSLVEIATAVRRFKSERSMGLGSELEALSLSCTDAATGAALRESATDLRSVTRARQVTFVADRADDGIVVLDGPVCARVIVGDREP